MFILDCTFRDGGYYTNWEFSDELLREWLLATEAAGSDIAEVGYKGWNTDKGPYMRCEEEFLRPRLPELTKLKLAFMIDVKEFVGKDATEVIPYAKDSVFSWVRIATHMSTLDKTKEMVGFMRERGYAVGVNIMGASLLTESQLALASSTLWNSGIEVLYFADSLGSLSPGECVDKLEALRSGFPVDHWSPRCGFHSHDNQGLAIANSMAVLDEGAVFIDGTVTGMGRGAGNGSLEQLMLVLKYRYGRDDLKPEALLPVIEKLFAPLQKQYGWGWSFAHHLTGVTETHPMYGQYLQLNMGLSQQQCFDQIMSIEDDKRHKFDKFELSPPRVAILIPARWDSSRFEGKPLVDILGTPMIVRVAALAAEAVGSENVWVCVTDQRIKDVVEAAGYQASPIMPLVPTGTDCIAEFAKTLPHEIIINVQGDEPVLEPGDILKVLDEKLRNPGAVVNGMCKLRDTEDPANPNIPKVVVGLDNRLVYMSRMGVPGSKKFDPSREYWKQVCIYAFNQEELRLFRAQPEKTPLEAEEDIEILRFLEMGMPVRMVETSGNSAAVDVPQDVKTVEDILRARP